MNNIIWKGNGVYDDELEQYCDNIRDQEDARLEVKFDDNWETHDEQCQEEEERYHRTC
jgi:hypothetical protein